MTLVPVTISTEVKCKFCMHPRREDVDRVLGRYFSREITREMCFEELRELGVDNPTADNLKRRAKEGHAGTHDAPRHTKWVEQATAEEEAAREIEARTKLSEFAAVLFVRILGEGWRERGITPSPEQILDIQRALYIHELELKIAAGVPSGLTHDQVLKTIGEGTKRKHSEAVDGLLGVAGKAIEAAIGGRVGLPPGPGHASHILQAARDEAEADIIDAEAVEIEEPDDS